MKSPISAEGAASAQNPLPPVPTTKILAISHFIGTPMTLLVRSSNEGNSAKISLWPFSRVIPESEQDAGKGDCHPRDTGRDSTTRIWSRHSLLWLRSENESVCNIPSLAVRPYGASGTAPAD